MSFLVKVPSLDEVFAFFLSFLSCINQGWKTQRWVASFDGPKVQNGQFNYHACQQHKWCEVNP
jgi:hypothetical protein